MDGRVRCYHRVNDKGAGLLEHEAAGLQRNADAARQRLARRARLLPGGLATPRPRGAPPSRRPGMSLECPRPAGTR